MKQNQFVAIVAASIAAAYTYNYTLKGLERLRKQSLLMQLKRQHPEVDANLDNLQELIAKLYD